MSVRTHSEMSYYRAMALYKLGQNEAAWDLLNDLLRYAESLAVSEPKIDYFATSLPAMLLFEEDLKEKNQATANFLRAQAAAGLGKKTDARNTLRVILERDPNHALATDFLKEIEIADALHAGAVSTR